MSKRKYHRRRHHIRLRRGILRRAIGSDCCSIALGQFDHGYFRCPRPCHRPSYRGVPRPQTRQEECAAYHRRDDEDDPRSSHIPDHSLPGLALRWLAYPWLAYIRSDPDRAERTGIQQFRFLPDL